MSDRIEMDAPKDELYQFDLQVIEIDQALIRPLTDWLLIMFRLYGQLTS